MLYAILAILSFLQSVIGFMLMTSSVMKFKTPIKKRIAMGLAAMILGITLLFAALMTWGSTSVDSFVIFVILGITLSWYLICSDDRFSVSLFSFLTFVNIYISISYISDTLAFNLEGNAFVGARIIIRTVIYLIILPLLFKYVRGHFRKLVDIIDKEWRVAVLMPLFFLVLQSIILYYPAPYWQWSSGNWSRSIILVVYMLFFAVYYLLYVQANAIVEKYVLEKRQLLMAQQEKLWEAKLIQQKSAEEKLKYLSYHDSMTELYNRTYINEIMNDKVDDGTVVFIFDIDKLKYVNDNYGHAEGDRLLQRFAKVLRHIFRDGKDIVARIGGDEFTAIINNSNEESAQNIKQGIIELISLDNNKPRNKDLVLSASIGYALKVSEDDTIEDLIKKADQRMYIDKHGKNFT